MERFARAGLIAWFSVAVVFGAVAAWLIYRWVGPTSETAVIVTGGGQAVFLLSEARARPGNIDFDGRLVNASAESQEVSFTGVSCGCNSVLVEGREIKSGERFTLAPDGTLAVSLRAPLADSATTSAYTARFRTLGAETGAKGECTLKCRVQTLADLEVMSGSLVLTLGKPSEKRIEKNLSVLARSRQRPGEGDVLRAVALPESWSWVSAKADDPTYVESLGVWARIWNVTVAYDRPDGLACAAAPASLILGLGTGVQATIPVLVRRGYGIDFPAEVHFGSVPVGQKGNRRAIIRSCDERPFKIINISSDSAMFTARPSSATDCQTQWIDFLFDPTSGGRHGGTITLETTHPECPRISVRVNAASTEASES